MAATVSLGRARARSRRRVSRASRSVGAGRGADDRGRSARWRAALALASVGPEAGGGATGSAALVRELGGASIASGAETMAVRSGFEPVASSTGTDGSSKGIDGSGVGVESTGAGPASAWGTPSGSGSWTAATCMVDEESGTAGTSSVRTEGGGGGGSCWVTGPALAGPLADGVGRDEDGAGRREAGRACGLETMVGSGARAGDESLRSGLLGGALPRVFASRRAAARSTRAFDRASSLVNRSVSVESPPAVAALNAVTLPSPRSSGSPLARASSNLRITPWGFGCAPSKITVVRVRVSGSRARNSSSVAYGRMTRTATGERDGSATFRAYDLRAQRPRMIYVGGRQARS